MDASIVVFDILRGASDVGDLARDGLPRLVLHHEVSTVLLGHDMTRRDHLLASLASLHRASKTALAVDVLDSSVRSVEICALLNVNRSVADLAFIALNHRFLAIGELWRASNEP